MKMKKVLSLLAALSVLSAAFGQQKYANMNVEDFSAFIADEQVQLLDVRTAAEFASGHIEGALLADMKSQDFLKTATAMLEKNRPVAVYCRSGKRSAAAAAKLAAEGYRVTNLRGGILAWTNLGLPTTPAESAPESSKPSHPSKKH